MATNTILTRLLLVLCESLGTSIYCDTAALLVPFMSWQSNQSIAGMLNVEPACCFVMKTDFCATCIFSLLSSHIRPTFLKFHFF